MFVLKTVVLRFTQLALMAVLCAHSAHAEQIDLSELSLEQLLEVKVSAASKFDQPTADAPSAVQIISAEDIKRHGWRTLTEALNDLPGIYFVNDRTYDYLGARGFQIPGDYNTRFLLLVDGQRNNDNIYQQALVGSEGWVDMSVVERIEYIPGPGSAIYGSNAMFGVINVITRSAGKTPLNHVGTHASQLGLSGFSVMSSRQVDETGLLLQYSSEKQSGRDMTYADPQSLLVRADGSVSPDGVAHGLDSGDNRHLLMRMDRGTWGIKLLNHERTVTPSSAAYLTVFDDPSLRINDGGTQLSAYFKHALSDSSEVNLRLAYTNWHYRATYPYLDPTIGYFLNYDDTHGEVLDSELSYTLHVDAHHMVAGMEISQDDLARQRNYNSVPATTLGTADVNINPQLQRRAMFIQDEWRMAAHWLLNLGLRFDTNSVRQSATSPRAGLIWQPNEDWSAKLLAGRAYRTPNAFESQFHNGFTNLANPDLRPETILTTEGVLEWKMDNRTRWMMSVFENKIENLIQQVDTNGAGLLQFQNSSWARVRGAELSTEISAVDELRLRSSIAINSSSSTLNANLDNSPRWLGKLSISTPVLSHRAFAAAEVHALSSRDFVWGGTPYRVGGEALANVTLSFPNVILKGLDAQLRVTNLFDHHVQHPASAEMPTPLTPGNGRNLMVNFGYGF